MKNIIYAENLQQVQTQKNYFEKFEESMIIKLPNNMGYYIIYLDSNLITEKLKSYNLQASYIQSMIMSKLKEFIYYKIDGMFNKKDFRYVKYELAFYEKRFCNATQRGNLKNNNEYQKFIDKSLALGLISNAELYRIENNVCRRYIKNTNMRPDKKNLIIKKEIFIQIKSRSTYIRNGIMFKNINCLEDFIAKKIEKSLNR